MNVTEAYLEAFKANYPSTEVELKRDRRSHTPAFFIFINGNKGDRSYTIDELRDATRMFNQGRRH